MLRTLYQIVLAILLAMHVNAAEKLPAYDELADAHRDAAAAVAQAHRENKLVLLVFGANWCPDCRAFEEEMNAPDLGSALALHYVVVKIDVARFKKNLDVASKYGLTVRRGIPAISIVSGDDKVLAVADGRKIEELRGNGRPALVKFFDAAVNAQQSAMSTH